MMRSYSENAVEVPAVAGPATAPVAVPPLPLDQVLGAVARDAAAFPARYLAETEVPEGGE